MGDGVGWQWDDLLPHLIDSFENGDFEMDENYTLDEIENLLNDRLHWLSKQIDEPFSNFLECYTALTQVKQAQLAAKQARALDQIVKHLRNIDECQQVR